MKWIYLLALICLIDDAGCCSRRAAPPAPSPPAAGKNAARDELSGASAPGNIAVSRSELRALSEELLTMDVNNVAALLTVDRQGRTRAGVAQDRAPEPLLRGVPNNMLSSPTFSAFWKLLDNYNASVAGTELQTPTKQSETDLFLNAVMATDIMKKTETFLRQKRLINKPLRQALKEIWFTPYTRSGRIVGSSGFEHVFVGEIKKGKVSGFHNWLNFLKEEQEGDLNYKGYMDFEDLGEKGEILLLHFDWNDDEKPASSMFIGTSPEFEMALYSICFFARQGGLCPIQLNGKHFVIKTWVKNYKGKKLLASAYLQL